MTECWPIDARNTKQQQQPPHIYDKKNWKQFWPKGVNNDSEFKLKAAKHTH